MSHADFQNLIGDVKPDLENNWALHRTIMAALCMIVYHDGRFNIRSKCVNFIFIIFFIDYDRKLGNDYAKTFTQTH